MGCLPMLLLFPLGCGVGYLVAGERGALWGAGIGFLLGLLAMALFIKALRKLLYFAAKILINTPKKNDLIFFGQKF